VLIVDGTPLLVFDWDGGIVDAPAEPVGDEPPCDVGTFEDGVLPPPALVVGTWPPEVDTDCEPAALELSIGMTDTVVGSVTVVTVADTDGALVACAEEGNVVGVGRHFQRQAAMYAHEYPIAHGHEAEVP
jgi:hypothetical protein